MLYQKIQIQSICHVSLSILVLNCPPSHLPVMLSMNHCHPESGKFNLLTIQQTCMVDGLTITHIIPWILSICQVYFLLLVISVIPYCISISNTFDIFNILVMTIHVYFLYYCDLTDTGAKKLYYI